MSNSPRTTRDKLIAEGLKALLTGGYDGAGIGPVLAAAGVPKGSFYHFFKSKEDFVGAVLDAYERRYIELRLKILGSSSRSPLRRLDDYFSALERLHIAERPLGGCLFGVLAQTATIRSARFRKRLTKVFATWDAHLQALLKEAQDAGEVDPKVNPREAASYLIDAYEGTLIRMKVEGTAAAFTRFKRFAIRSIRT